MEVGGAAGFMGHHLTLDVPNDVLEDDEKTVYTEYAPLGVCAGQSVPGQRQIDTNIK